MVELFNSILPSLFLLLKIDFSIKNTLSRFMDRVFFRYYSNLSKSNTATFDYRYVSTTVYLIF